MNLARVIYMAYHYFLRGEPFPYDVQEALVSFNIDPSELEERFTDGAFPEGAEIIDPEDDPEDADYRLCGNVQDLLDTLRKTNTILTKFFNERS